MEKKHSSCPFGACEKFFKAIAVRKVRRISHHSQPPLPANSPPPASTIVKVEAAHHLKTPQNKEAAEVIPFSSSLPAPPNEKAKPATLQALLKNGQATEGLPAPLNEKAKPATLEALLKNGQAASKTQPLSHIIPVEKVKTKSKVGTDGAQRAGNTLVPSYSQVAKVPSKIENQPPQVNREEGRKSGVNIDDRCTEYINRASIKIRATSNVGHDGKSSSSVTSIAGEDKYSNKDHFADYINRATLKIRTMSSFVGGRSDSIK